MASGTGGFEVYLKAGVGGNNFRGKGRKSKKKTVEDPSFNMFGKRRKVRRKDLNKRTDGKGFRDRNGHLDQQLGPFPECPSEWTISGALTVFVRGSAGAYFGVQFNGSYTWPITSPSFEGIKPGSGGWNFSAARGVYGLSVEAGGGGSLTFEFTLLDSTE